MQSHKHCFLVINSVSLVAYNVTWQLLLARGRVYFSIPWSLGELCDLPRPMEYGKNETACVPGHQET